MEVKHVHITGSGSTTVDEYIDAFSTKPSSVFRQSIDHFINGTKDDGNWTLHDHIWLRATPTEQAARISMVDPLVLNTFNGGYTFTPNQGIKGNASNAYIGLNWAGGGVGANYQNTSAFRWYYVRQVPTTGIIAGAYAGTAENQFQINTGGTFAYFIMNGKPVAANVTNSYPKVLLCQRIGDVASIYVNGVLVGSSSANYLDGVTYDAELAYYVFGLPQNYSDVELSMSGYGGGVLDHVKHYNRIIRLAQKIGF